MLPAVEEYWRQPRGLQSTHPIWGVQTMTHRKFQIIWRFFVFSEHTDDVDVHWYVKAVKFVHSLNKVGK